MRPREILLCSAFVLGGCKDDAPEPKPEPRAESSEASKPDETPDPKPEVVEPKPEPSSDPTATPDNHKRGLAAITRDIVKELDTQPGDPLAFLPARITMVGQIQPAKFYAVPGFEGLIGKILDRGDADFKRTLESMAACKAGPETIESFTIAMDEKQDGVLVVRGPGFGKSDTWRCIRTEIVSRGGDPDYEVVERGTKTVLVNDEDEGRFVDDDTFVFFETSLTNEVENLIDGTAKTSVVTGGLAETIGRVKTDEALWFAGLLPPEAQSELRHTPLNGMDEVWGALAIGSDHAFALTVAGRAPSADEAKRMRDEVDKSWVEVKPMGASFGVPSEIVDSIEFKASGDTASFHMRATVDQLDVVREKFISMF